MIPVRLAVKDVNNKNRYFSAELASKPGYELSWWGGINAQSNKILADYYLEQVQLLEKYLNHPEEREHLKIDQQFLDAFEEKHDQAFYEKEKVKKLSWNNNYSPYVPFKYSHLVAPTSLQSINSDFAVPTSDSYDLSPSKWNLDIGLLVGLGLSLIPIIVFSPLFSGVVGFIASIGIIAGGMGLCGMLSGYLIDRLMSIDIDFDFAGKSVLSEEGGVQIVYPEPQAVGQNTSTLVIQKAVGSDKNVMVEPEAEVPALIYPDEEDTIIESRPVSPIPKPELRNDKILIDKELSQEEFYSTPATKHRFG